MHRPRILVIENAVAITGGVNSIIRSSEALKDYFEFFFVLPKGSAVLGQFQTRNYKVFELPMRELRKNIISILLYIPYLLVNIVRLNQLIKSQGITLIVSNDFYNMLPTCYKIFGGKIPYVCFIRFLPSKFPSPLVSVWCALHKRYAGSVIAVSEAVKKELSFTKNVVVISDQLPITERHPLGHLLNQEKLTYTFLYLANFINGKGQNYALDAFAIVANELPLWKLRFVGGDMGLIKNKDYKNELIEKSLEGGIEKKIEWCEFTEDPEFEYKQADIVLNFSESESFSLTCLDALFFGKPVIATDCGGPAEIVNDGETGLLVPNKNVTAMAQAMIKLATDRKLRSEMSAKSRYLMLTKFSQENTSFRLRDVYNLVIKLYA